MGIIGSGLMLVGWLMGLVGAIMILIVAFKQSIWWGLGSLFIPLVILIFTFMNWAETKKGFLIWLAGFGLVIVGIIVAALGGGHAATR